MAVAEETPGILDSKTKIGTAIVAAALVAQAWGFVPDQGTAESIAQTVETLGGLLAAFGLRDAIAKLR